jgi:hypothetical protein
VGIQFFSRDLGDVDNNRIVVDWAFGDYRIKDYFGVRLGIMKRPEGFYNETRDIDSLRTWILNPSSFYPEEYRESELSTQGLGLYGKVAMKKAGALDYQFQVGTQNLPTDQALGKSIANTGFDVKEFNTTSIVVGSLIWNTPLSGFRVGTTGSYYEADIDTVANKKLGPMAGTPVLIKYSHYLTTFSGEYIYQNLTLMSEFKRFDSKNATPFYTRWNPTYGWYIGGSYRFNRWFEAGSYYGEFYQDKNNKTGQGLKYPFKSWSKEWDLSARFDINEHFTIKAEGHWFDGVGTFSSRLNPTPVQDTFLFALKASFNF